METIACGILSGDGAGAGILRSPVLLRASRNGATVAAPNLRSSLRLRRSVNSRETTSGVSTSRERTPPLLIRSSPSCLQLQKVGEAGFSPHMVAPAFFIFIVGLLLSIIQFFLASPAYAAFQSTASTGGKFVTSELLSSASAGFFAGCLHTLSGPDHLAALAPLSIGRTRIESAIVGALWGCGHDAGQMLFGLLFLLLKDRLHIEVIQMWGTRVVALTLLAIGAMGIKEASEVPTSCVALEDGAATDVDIPREKKKIGFATFATGIVHGLQPDALMMILPALALPSRMAGAAFLGMFLVGTVLAMSSYTVFLGSCSQALKGRVPRITEKLSWAASLVAIFMGAAILISQFFGFSFF